MPVAYFKVFSESLFFLQHRLLLLFNELKLPQLQCNSSQSQTVKRRKGSDLLVLHYHQHHPQHSTPLPAEIPTTTLSFLLSPHPLPHNSPPSTPRLLPGTLNFTVPSAGSRFVRRTPLCRATRLRWRNAGGSCQAQAAAPAALVEPRCRTD